MRRESEGLIRRSAIEKVMGLVGLWFGEVKISKGLRESGKWLVFLRPPRKRRLGNNNFHRIKPISISETV